MGVDRDDARAHFVAATATIVVLELLLRLSDIVFLVSSPLLSMSGLLDSSLQVALAVGACIEATSALLLGAVMAWGAWRLGAARWLAFVVLPAVALFMLFEAAMAILVGAAVAQGTLPQEQSWMPAGALPAYASFGLGFACAWFTRLRDWGHAGGRMAVYPSQDVERFPRR